MYLKPSLRLGFKYIYRAFNDHHRALNEHNALQMGFIVIVKVKVNGHIGYKIIVMKMNTHVQDI